MDDFSDHLPQPYKGFFLRKSDGFFIPTSEDKMKVLDVIRKNKLKKVEISPLYFKSNDISFLIDADFIESINILSDGVDLSPINQLKKLKEIAIQPVKGKTKGKIDFNNFPLLKTCFLDWGAGGAESIFTNTHVSNLTLDGFDRLELYELGALPQLKELSIRSSPIVSTAGIEKLRCLKKLELMLCKMLESLNGINELSGLVKLHIEHCKNIKDYHLIGEISSLEYLNLSNAGIISSINFVSHLRNLKEIHFAENTNIKDGNLSYLENLRKNFRLKECLFQNRRHYSHKREDLGYELSPYLKKLFGKYS